MTKSRRKGINSRAKGQRGEREAIGILQPIVNQVYSLYNVDIPVLQRNTLQSDQGGYDVVGLAWLALEVKAQENVSIVRYWNQALAQAAPHQEPIVLFKQKFREFTAIMRVSLPCGSRFIHAFALVDIDTFKLWFRARLAFELERDLRERGLLEA